MTANFESTRDQQPHSIDVEQEAIDQAVEMINDGRLSEAISLLSNLVINGSSRWEVYHLLGLLFEHSGTTDIALRHLQTAATLEVSGSTALRDLVRLFVDQKEYGKAIGCLAQIVKRDGADETLIHVLTQLLADMPASHTDLDWLSPEIPALQKLASSSNNSSTPPMTLAGGAAMPRPSQSKLPVTDRRLAFLVHTKELLNHYRSVCRLLPPASFVFLIHAEDTEAAAIAEAIHQEGWGTLTTSEALDNKRYFRALVSNHPLSIGEPPLIKRLADTNVRFMYAAGKSGWNLSDWNRLYDVILCYGPYHADRFLQSTAAQVVQMGYPRFDSFFAPGFDPVGTARQFGCDPQRKTVVWLPTWSSLSSVGIFDNSIAALCSDFNVVVKVHPLMAADEPEKVDALERLGFARVIRDATDNVPLYRIADYVLCDYGGPAFGAIYADRNLLLLDVAAAEKNELLESDSPEIMIREHIAHVDSRQPRALAELLADEGLWAAQAQHRAALRRLFFAPYFGYASRIAADILSNLDSINQRRMQG